MFLGNNSKTVNNIRNLTWDKNDQHSKIYLPCNFEVKLIIFNDVNPAIPSKTAVNYRKQEKGVKI